MKIELKLIPTHILALAGALDHLSRVHPCSQSQRIVQSVMNLLVTRVHKKRVEISNVSNLFNQKKKIKVPLEYFEAAYLEIYLAMIIENPNQFELSEYDKNALLSIVNELNQKLA
jgi:hypothetical protein